MLNKQSIPKAVVAAILPLLLTSCFSDPLLTCAVQYQSVRIEQAKHPDKHENAEIKVAYCISQSGELAVAVRNLTNERMIVDQTKSFFVNSSGISNAYYDPTVRTTTEATSKGGTTGASVNLGAISSALGVGGAVGSLLGGINVGGAQSSVTTVTNSIQSYDLPQVGIGPQGTIQMSKYFEISNIALRYNDYVNTPPINNHYSTRADSPIQFCVAICYSVDNGESFKTLTTNMYVNSRIVVPVTSKTVNDGIRQIYTFKPDAVNEPYWWIATLNNQPKLKHLSTYFNGVLVDYQ